ncbi:TetR/AcrR family transcriptional regulator [Desulfonatronovibrio magnus]|uniref:TetR/AcrR family transcriptional regulator n=1 Tax=Desulfonatronovibrio magnus TaxID=698827 RepID=UPI0005EAD419|nr:TetR/AcrR family transcriptional regulator [Desulfonatronovibrio magnus]
MAKNRKVKIVATAKKLFATQGFDSTSLQQIADGTGVTEPLMYYHFRGKEDIFIEIIRSVYEEYFAHIKSLPQNPGTQFDKISNLIRLHINIAANRPNDGRLILSHCPSSLKKNTHIYHEIMQERHDLITGYLRDCLETGNAAGEFDAHPVEELVIVIACLLKGVIHRKLLGRISESSYEYTAIEFCRRALMPNPVIY